MQDWKMTDQVAGVETQDCICKYSYKTKYKKKTGRTRTHNNTARVPRANRH